MDEQKYLVVAVSKETLATMVAKKVSNRFSLIVNKIDSSNWKGYKLYIDPVDRSDEDLEYIRGYAHGVLETLNDIIPA